MNYITNAKQLTNLLSVDFLEQDPLSEISTHSESQEIPNIVWHVKVQYCVRNGPDLSHLRPGHTLQPSFFKMHFNNIISSVSGSMKINVGFKML